MKKDITICFRTSDELRTSLEKVAKEGRRSLSAMIENILYDFLKEKRVSPNVDKEKRRYFRKGVALPTFVYETGTEAREAQAGIIVDISLGGLRISVPRDCKIEVNDSEGKQLDLLFTLPNEKAPITMKCKPARVSDNSSEIEVGASFVDSDFRSYQKLQNYLIQ